MNTLNLFRKAALALAIFTVLFVSGANPASAQVYATVRVGTPPPPLIVEHRWAPPYRGAVWISGHHEWVRGGWVWVAGYYTYPPRRGGYWVRPRWHHGYYYPGHWAY